MPEDYQFDPITEKPMIKKIPLETNKNLFFFLKY